MNGFVIFGAGNMGRQAVRLLGKDKIAYIIDNDISKKGCRIDGLEIRYAPKEYDSLKNAVVIIAVGDKYYTEIRNQLLENGITHIQPFSDMAKEIIKENIANRTDYISIYNAAIEWIRHNTISEEHGKSIITTSDELKGYPEVTGYFIPTLIRAGYRDLALEYAKWLCSIQHKDGSWWDTNNTAPYTFDSGQILKGLLAIREMMPSVDSYIIKGCDWLITNIQPSGRMITFDKSSIGNIRECSELVHLYCLSPLLEAADIFEKPQYREAAHKVLDYYKTNYRSDITHFRILSHFYAYIVEAMLDLGEIDLAKEAMDRIAVLQTSEGAVPAYHDVHWVCSTGLFQLATIWFRLGDREHGDKAFRYAMSLQNQSGGWYGSYQDSRYPDEENDYFPCSEISWALKYFLDALYYKNVADFTVSSPQFFGTIDRSESRYQAVFREAKKVPLNGKIIDVGCSRGRYIKNLLLDVPHCEYYGVDIATSGMDMLKDERVHKKAGSLSCIPYSDNTFDLAYACEALEHCVDTESSVRELARVVKPGGRILIVDKNKSALGEMEICEWEQWFSTEELQNIMMKYCSSVTVDEDLPYDGKHGVFSAWSGTVK